MTLPFHKEIFSELLEEDGLLIMARGLGLHKIFLQFLRFHANSKEIVFALNVPAYLQQLWIEELLELGVSPRYLPKRINAEYTLNERNKMYLEGGVHFITSTILVMDLLYKRLPTHLIGGFLVYNAHTVAETSTESFILRLFRKGNKKGFIKAFTEYPERFNAGFLKLEKVLKSMLLTKVYLWPRFRDTVNSCLDAHRPDVVELHQPLSPLAHKIQTSILEIMDACITEIQKTNMVDLPDYKVEDGLFKEFDTLIRSQLDPVWHKIGPKTKQLVSDLKTLRRLLLYLLRYDCVSFWRYLDNIRSREFGSYSEWLFMDAADALFKYAKTRVFTPIKRSNSTSEVPKSNKKPKTSSSSKDDSNQDSVNDSNTDSPASQPEQQEGTSGSNVNNNNSNEVQFEPVLEENPKWQLLVEVLNEIEKEDDSGKTGKAGKILVIVKDETTCTQLQEYLDMGGSAMLKRRFQKYLEYKQEQREHQLLRQQEDNKPSSTPSWLPRGKSRSAARGRGRGREATPLKKTITPAARSSVISKSSEEPSLLMKMLQPNNSTTVKDIKQKDDTTASNTSTTTTNTSASNAPDSNGSEVSKEEEVKEEKSATQTLLEEFEEYFGIIAPPHIVIHTMSTRQRILEELRPKFVVMYDPDISFFRQLEVYKAENPGMPLRVYWLCYSDSVEEKMYLTGLAKEETAFKKLIAEKSTMSIPVDVEADSEIAVAMETTSSRKGGKSGLLQMQKKKKVIVDSREFRSALPAILYQRDFEILPATLDVGDYIVTKDIAVERKSVSDLYSSFASGRLFNQISALCRHFKKPTLLIEFSEDKPFMLQDEYTEEISPMSIISKLVLLTKHFPNLSLLWCRTPYAAAELFEELKTNQEEPEVEGGMIADDEDDTHDAAESILRTLPGITSQNIYTVMNKVKNLCELSQMSLQQLSQLIGKKNAQLLYNYFKTIE